MWRSYELFCDIHLTKVNFFFAPYVVKLAHFAAIHLKGSPFTVQNGQSFLILGGQLLRDIAQLYSDLGTLSSTSSSSTPKLQNIRSKVSMTRSSL